MTKFGKLIAAFFVVAALGGGAYWAMHKGGQKGSKTALPEFNFSAARQTASAGPDVSAFPQSYENTDYGFTFSYPDGFEVREIDEDRGFTVLAEGKGNKMFQIYIQSFDEEGPITPERIKKDLPEIKILGSQAFDLNGTPALAFQADTTVEVWFVHGGNLYQITSLKDFTDNLSRILSTWRFE